MKRIVAILLLSVYSLCSTGMAVQLHYCCGKLADMSLGYSNDHEGDCGHGMKAPMPGCCHNTEVQVKVDDASGASISALPEPATSDAGFIARQEILPLLTDLSGDSHQPVRTRVRPPGIAPPLYLQYRVFRN